MVKNCIAVIPARGGSKRLPGKNIIDFHGVPMIAKTICAALESKLFAHVIVSTDSEEIAEVARKYGAEVPFLRTEHCDDFSTVSQATIFAVGQAEAYFQEQFAAVVQLMANCPLRSSAEIVDAYENFLQQGANFQISCFPYGWMNPWWAAKLDENNVAIKLFPETGEKRSQDLEKLYCPTGAIWIADVAALRQAGTFYGEHYRMYPMPWQKAVDIDDADDLQMALLLDEMGR